MRFYVELYYQAHSSITITSTIHAALNDACAAFVSMGVSELEVTGLFSVGRITITATIRAETPATAMAVLQPIAADIFTAALGNTQGIAAVGYAIEPEPTAALTPTASRTLDALVDRLDLPGPVIINTALAHYAHAHNITPDTSNKPDTSTSDRVSEAAPTPSPEPSQKAPASPAAARVPAPPRSAPPVSITDDPGAC